MPNNLGIDFLTHNILNVRRHNLLQETDRADEVLQEEPAILPKLSKDEL